MNEISSADPKRANGGTMRLGWSVIAWIALIALIAVIAMVAGIPVVRRMTSPSKEVLFQKGLERVSRGDIVSAREMIRSLHANGAPEMALLVQARVLLAKGFLQPAIDSLEDVEGGADIVKMKLLVQGEAAYRMGQHSETEAALIEVLAIDSQCVDAHRLLAASYYDIGAVHAAIHHLTQTAQLSPRDPRPHRLLALIHKDYELFDEAIPLYKESLRRGPDQPDRDDLLFEMASCQVKMRQPREALNTLAMGRDGVHENVLRAECQLGLGDIEEARTLIVKVTKNEADNLDAMVLLGTILLEDGDATGAAEVLLRASTKYPKDYLCHFKLAQAFTKMERLDDARQEREIAEQIRTLRKEFAELHQVAWDNPEDPKVRLRLAALAAELLRPDLEQVWLHAAAAVGEIVFQPQP